jgi:hypothetical protein
MVCLADHMVCLADHMVFLADHMVCLADHMVFLADHMVCLADHMNLLSCGPEFASAASFAAEKRKKLSIALPYSSDFIFSRSIL